MCPKGKSLAVMISVFALAFAFVPRLEAATVTAASCSYSHVQSAVNAASHGDTVNIPAGNCTWTSKLLVTVGITLQGAGMDRTNITDGVSNDAVIQMSVNSPNRQVLG